LLESYSEASFCEEWIILRIHTRTVIVFEERRDPRTSLSRKHLHKQGLNECYKANECGSRFKVMPGTFSIQLSAENKTLPSSKVAHGFSLKIATFCADFL
jgi:hypothetical protein